MKKITLLFITLLSAALGYAQTELTTNGDFETGDGTGWTGGALQVRTEGGNSFNFADVAVAGTPFSANISNAVVLKPNTWYELSFTASTSAATAGRSIIVGIGQSADPFISATKPISITASPKTYSEKFNSAAWGGGSVAQRVIFDMGAAVGVVVIDNVSLVETTAPAGPTPPTTAAPTPPTRNATDVISVFSDAYTNITVDTFDTSWCPGTSTDIMVENNVTKQVTGLGCEGIEFLNGKFDANGFTHFHMDIYTETATLDKSFNLKFSNWNKGTSEANAIEFSVTNASSPALPNPNPGTWISLDIPLSSWDGYSASDATKQNDLAQFIITSNLGTVFYDNVYFYKEGTASIEDELLASVSLFPNPVNSGVDLRISAKEKIQNAKIYNVIGKEVMSIAINNTSKDIDVSSLNTGVYLIKYTINNAVGTSKFIKQ